ncbi:phosphatase PAP2 family protein [Thaumasiovibrio subtropicus]|uniref:phosphatase PAP2 family protein n=1 Tax=Thaumasiovibrio subtropicus TaxID=1891207 RepID=UPI000B35A5A0|nr:phosphatase PAP2 family protein [Thaumasiovibrio subtropicus]
MMILAPIQRFDYAFSTLCLCHRFNLVTAKISRAISRTGDGHLYVVIALLVVMFDQQKGAEFLSLGLMAFAIELPIYFLLKNSVKRDRPTELPSFIKPSDRYSLPSGHTAAAFIMAALVSYFYPSFAPYVWVWASLVGLSRVMLGVHYFSDIIAGIVLGLSAFQFATEML